MNIAENNSGSGRMTRRRLVSLLLAISLSFTFVAFAETIALEPGKTGLLDYSDKGYMLFVPQGVPPHHYLPLLICLPAVGVDVKQDIDHWSSLAGEKGFMVLDLDMEYARIASFADVDAVYSRIMGIIGSLAKQYSLNKDKLYIAGTSAGGMLAISLGLRYPDEFIAIGVVSGAYLRFGAEEELANATGCRIYMVHGAKDEIVPVKMFYSTKEILEKHGAIIKFSVFPDDGHPVSPGGYKQVVEWMAGLEPHL